MSSSAATSEPSAPDARVQSSQIIGLFPDLLGVGGVQEAGRMTAAALSEIVRKREGKADFLSLNGAPGTRTIDINGRTISLRGFGRAKVRFVMAGIGRATKLRKDRAGFILAAHPYLAVPATLMQRFAPNLKIIVVAHGIEVWTALSPSRRRALLHANLVLAPSRFTAQKLTEAQGVPPEKTRVLPWPLGPQFLRMSDEPVALPLPPSFPTGRIILTVARCDASERYKGADELIRAVAELRPSIPDLHLVAVGDGNDLPRLVQLANSLGLSDRVHFFSGLSREQIAACYSRADIFALPSTGEGFGLVFLEAMAFAKPVVGADFGGATDVVQDGVNGLLVPPHDAHKLADALSKLLRDDSLRAQLGQAGAEIARGKYAFSVFRERLERILEECGFPEVVR
ncbi:MAG: glycosyltransferase family 4 protein [Candidatus Acidiferrales bacterium]